MQGQDDLAFTQIWPGLGREQLALQLGAIHRDGHYYIDSNRRDENALKLKRLFGSDAARRAREAQVIANARSESTRPGQETAGAAADAPHVIKRVEAGAADTTSARTDAAPDGPSPDAAPRKTLSLAREAVGRINADGSDGQPDLLAVDMPVRQPSFNAIMFEEPVSWRWTDMSLEIGGIPGAVFMPVRAQMIPGAKPRIEITVDNDIGTGTPSRKVVTIEADPKNAQKSLDLALRRFLEDPTLRARTLKRAADLNQENRNLDGNAGASADSAEDAAAATNLLDKILATAGGAGGPTIAWRPDCLERPKTSALAGMRGVVTSGRIYHRSGGSKMLKLVIDYRGFATQNAAIAEAGGKKGPGPFETINLHIPAFDAQSTAAIAKRIAAVFEPAAAPSSEIEPGQITAAEARKSDERLLLAKAANVEVERRGETPPAPLPPVNNAKSATRVHFWTAREDESPYCYKKLIAVAAEAGIPLLVDRASGSRTWGLRYIEATQAEIAALPEGMTRFLTEDAREAHLASKDRRRSSNSLMADAAATAALEVTTRQGPSSQKNAEAPTHHAHAAANNGASPAASGQTPHQDEESKPLHPLTVPHPDTDRDGWFRARAAIRNIEPTKLIRLIDFTAKMHDELEIKKDMKRTIGEDLDIDDLTRLTTWRHGINLAKEALLARGIRYQDPEKRSDKDAVVHRDPIKPQSQKQSVHERAGMQVER